MYFNKLAFNNYKNFVLFQRPKIVVFPSVNFVIGTNLKIACYNAANRLYTTSIEPNASSQVKERERLEKFIKKSKILTKLNGNPKFNDYFEKLKETGTIPTITSFFILHELTAVIPLFMIWYILYHSDFWDEFNITESSNPLLVKCNKAIERLVGDKCESLDKHKLIITGAVSYSIVKVMGPLRMFVSLWAAPYFGRYLIVPFHELRLFLKRIWSKYQ